MSDEYKDHVDKVNHPSHYNQGKIEVLEFIEDQDMGEPFCKGNILKYGSRVGHKGKLEDEIKDLNKIRFYAKRMIEYRMAKIEKREVKAPNLMFNHNHLLSEIKLIELNLMQIRDRFDIGDADFNNRPFNGIYKALDEIKKRSKEML